MSLTSQLHGGQLAAWCADRLAGTAAAAAQVDAAVRGHRPLDRGHWAEVRGAFGLRLAALVEPSPAYHCLYGLVRAGVVSREWADEQAGEAPTHAGLPAGVRQRALEVRPSPTGWLDLGDPLPTHVTTTAAEPVLAELFDRARRYQAEHAPPGQLGTPGAEAGLARMCWLLSRFADLDRTDAPGKVLHGLFGRSVPSVEAMRAAAPEPVVAELVELARRLHTSGSLAQLRRLAGNPPAGRALGHATPTVVPHWAEADLLLCDGRASTLLEVTTVIGTEDTERTGRWLWRLLGHAWLDVADRWRIRRVGLYLARHGVLLTWPVTELATVLLGERGHHGRLAQARGEFLTLAERVLTAEGARPPT